METLLALWLIATADKVWMDINVGPPEIKVEKLQVKSELYYPDLKDDMWDPNWINNKT